ncbi:MAG: aminoglycoside adenylyltransferase domain-containing protein [Devosia sp.]
MNEAAAKSTIDLAAATFAELVRRYGGDLVTGLHFVGSIADGDFRPGKSDLDFVAVLSRSPTDLDLEALGIIHRSYGSDPTFPKLDGVWLTDEDLRNGPDAAADGPTSAEGTFLAQAQGNRNPVTWISLQRSISIIGGLDRQSLWQDRDRLKSWVKDNAARYWRRWHAQASGWGMPGLTMLGRAAPMWGVLGIARQHYTVSTGEIASKSTAGGWALESFDGQYRRIIEEALAFRRGASSAYRNPLARRRDALAFVGMAIKAVTGSQH